MKSSHEKEIQMAGPLVAVPQQPKVPTLLDRVTSMNNELDAIGNSLDCIAGRCGYPQQEAGVSALKGANAVGDTFAMQVARLEENVQRLRGVTARLGDVA